MESLKDKVIIIMGASSGIGEATVRKIAAKGGRQVIAARREDKLKAIADSLPDAEVKYMAADVSKYEDVERVVKLAIDTWGRVDVIFNNAGIMPTGNLIEARRDEWKKMLDVNIMGVLNGISAVLPVMRKQQSGHIIATDSVAGHVVYPGSAVYCGTKYAVRAIMEGLRQEERMNNIKSTIVSPGSVDTDLYKTVSDKAAQEALRKLQGEIGMHPDDIADAVVYVIETPANVSVSDIIIRPTRQEV